MAADAKEALTVIVGSDEEETKSAEDVNPRSRELVIGLVGYAGAGFSSVTYQLGNLLKTNGYEVSEVKLSKLIEEKYGKPIDAKQGNENKGESLLRRANTLQDYGDALRKEFGEYAVASLAIQDIRKKRKGEVGAQDCRAYIIDCIKHPHEIDLLRRVYDKSFRLIAVHVDQDERIKRLKGQPGSEAKFAGASKEQVENYIDRDAADPVNRHGQQVRKAFHLADFFLDNNVLVRGSEQPQFVKDLVRFCTLLLGGKPVAPRKEEMGMYYAHAASLQSSCLSRQVGASIIDANGNLLSTGANEVPKFGGGVYAGDTTPNDGRCYSWNGNEFVGCHNTQRKKSIKQDIGTWLSTELNVPFDGVLKECVPEDAVRSDILGSLLSLVSNVFVSQPKIPHLGDLIEFSRSVHAEMNAIISAGRNGNSVKGGVLYTTTYPCHNCTRHIVAAGVSEVRFIEPYVKSLAINLHSDAVTISEDEKSKKMLIAPFTGVGPRMYEDYFIKMGENKDPVSGAFLDDLLSGHVLGVRQLDIDSVEKSAAELIK